MGSSHPGLYIQAKDIGMCAVDDRKAVLNLCFQYLTMVTMEKKKWGDLLGDQSSRLGK